MNPNLLLDGLPDVDGGLHEPDAAVLLADHEQAHHLVHDDDGHLVGRQEADVVGVGGLLPLGPLVDLLPLDRVPQRLEPAQEQGLHVGEARGEALLEHDPLELLVLRRGPLPGLGLGPDLAPAERVVAPPGEARGRERGGVLEEGHLEGLPRGGGREGFEEEGGVEVGECDDGGLGVGGGLRWVGEGGGGVERNHSGTGGGGRGVS